MSKHTPGPWRKGNANYCHKIFAGDQAIAEVWGSTRGRRISARHAEAQSNARLIAAAPEMLDVLKATYTMLFNEGLAESQPWVNRGLDQIRAAIAKAEGSHE